MRLQEAANLSGAQSCDSDTNSMDSVGMSSEDIHKTVEISVWIFNEFIWIFIPNGMDDVRVYPAEDIHETVEISVWIFNESLWILIPNGMDGIGVHYEDIHKIVGTINLVAELYDKVSTSDLQRWIFWTMVEM